MVTYIFFKINTSPTAEYYGIDIAQQTCVNHDESAYAFNVLSLEGRKEDMPKLNHI